DRPENQPLRGAAYASLLDAGANASASALDGRLGWNVGVRKAQARRFFSTQELQGNYRPDYTDFQALVGYRLAPGHELESVGVWAGLVFGPDSRARLTFFGVISADPSTPSGFRSVFVTFDDASHVTDSCACRFAGLRLTRCLSPPCRIEHDASYYGTE